MFIVGLLILIVGLLISVALHELGHLLPAKKFGALVPEYWIGFGPTLLSKQVRGTTYGIKAILLGGYVRILGMFPSEVAGAKTRKANGQLTMAAQAREVSGEELAEARAKGLVGKPFYALKTGQKLVVMLGGPLMNLALAFLLTVVAVVGFGWREVSTTIGEVVPGDSEQAPAAAAGILPGDRVVSWGSEPIETWEQLRTHMGESGAQETIITVERDGELLELPVTPVVEADGQARIGVTSQVVRVRGDVGQALAQTGTMFTGTAQALMRLPVGLWELGQSFFTDAERDPNGVLSVVGVARIAGEVTAADSDTGITLGDQAALLFSLLASLNMALFVFNLLPLPPLDGGHVVGALWGGAKNRWAALRGKPAPGPVDTARLVPLSQGVFVVLALMTAILVVADIVKPLQLF